jgi:hypothetical protein
MNIVDRYLSSLDHDTQVLAGGSSLLADALGGYRFADLIIKFRRTMLQATITFFSYLGVVQYTFKIKKVVLRCVWPLLNVLLDISNRQPR